MKISSKIAVLEVHKLNLENAKTFDEYRKVHVEWVQYLINTCKAEEMALDAVNKFADATAELMCKVETKE